MRCSGREEFADYYLFVEFVFVTYIGHKLFVHAIVRENVFCDLFSFKNWFILSRRRKGEEIFARFMSHSYQGSSLSVLEK